ncbi:MAG: nickel-responsive transcriptional regulator NikR [Candidatus Bathyarchaeota archaeon]|nr:nickel-responsive transcriptional regulator NikR [Candidatus Bathyarchaeota archaeon]
MSKIVRVGVTFPPGLLKELDEMLEEMGYESRSKAVQDSVRTLVSEHKWLRKQKGTKVGVLVMLYDHEVKGLDEALIDAQHEHADVIYSSMHIHLSERECLETIAVKGEVEEIRRLVQVIKTKRGVKQVKLSIVP